MKLTQKHRIYPNKHCQNQLSKQEGCNRFIWNETLAHMKRLGYWLTYEEMAEFLTHQLKSIFPFLYEVSAQSLQQTLKNLHHSIKAHTRKNNLTNEPKFKKKSWYKSMRFPQKVRVDHERQLLYLPRLMDHPIPIVLERDLPQYTMVTIIKESDDKWYACFITGQEVKFNTKYVDTKHLGIDMGLIDFITTSKGEKIKAPKFFRKSEKKLAKLNKELARKSRGSKRWNKTKKRLSYIHTSVRHKRNDWLHKLSHRIANDNTVEAVAVETLHIQNMIKNKKLAKSIGDVSWKLFVTYLEYKLTLRGKILTYSDWKHPSTQLCSNCYEKTGPKGDLSVRRWTCTSCGSTHDRDINVAINIARDANKRLAA